MHSLVLSSERDFFLSELLILVRSSCPVFHSLGHVSGTKADGDSKLQRFYFERF